MTQRGKAPPSVISISKRPWLKPAARISAFLHLGGRNSNTWSAIVYYLLNVLGGYCTAGQPELNTGTAIWVVGIQRGSLTS